MNFPDSAKTGALAELALITLFTDWSWGVGEDRIDIGYDLTVQPSNDLFFGHRFHVQAKGTASKKNKKISVQVSKARLREYHKNPHPVFIVRSTGDGQLYWLHAQSWTQKNLQRLNGNGKATVSFPKENDLRNRDQFTEYLTEVLAPLASKPDALANLAQERSKLLSEIDPRLVVQVEYSSGITTHHFSAASEDVQIPMAITPKDSGGHEQLRNHFRYGTPALVELEEIKISGSEVFEKLEIGSGKGATIEIGPAVHRKGAIELWAGEKFNYINEKVHIPCRYYSGHQGFALDSVLNNGLLTSSVRASMDAQKKFTFNLDFNSPAFEGAPIRNLTELRILGNWADEVLNEGILTMRFTVNGKSASISRHLADEPDFLMMARLSLLAKLHRIACALDLDVVIDPRSTISKAEASSIALACDLLKGITVDSKAEQQDIASDTPIEPPEDRTYCARINLDVRFGSKSVCAVPVRIEFRDYDQEFDNAARQIRLLPRESSSATLRFDPNIASSEEPA